MSIINPAKVAMLLTDRDDQKSVRFYSTERFTEYFVDHVDADTYERMDHIEDETTELIEASIAQPEVSSIALAWNALEVSLAPNTDVTQDLVMRLKSIFLRRFGMNPHETEFAVVLNHAEGMAWITANSHAA